MTYPPLPPGYFYVPVRPPVPTSPGGLPLADFGTRLAAYIIDVAVLSLVAVVFAVPAFFVLFTSLPDPEQFAYDDGPSRMFSEFLVPILLFELVLYVAVLILYYLYVVEYMHRSGQTIGKKAMKIRVIPLDPGKRLTRGMAAKRYLIEYGCGTFVPFFSYVDGLWQLWDKPYQQALHDKVAQTVVVKVSP
ncbi:putative RDD family membrane protein YckC [Actinoplanes tereljensis]|uniref:RDD family protein n=1 Tax=Paractinoplanes tereljensis TaxID=571912 RepID=A0A919NS14_9ACTN|nr:RDD family protein [Actinoplanes tereljensis]GIF24106.1 RDD family protein [Actinoplanes tereljensis]